MYLCVHSFFTLLNNDFLLLFFFSFLGSVDIWEPKVIRSGCGSHFRVPILNSIPWSQVPNYISPDAQILLASASLTDQLMNQKVNTLNFEELESLINLSEEQSDHETSDEMEESSDDSEENTHAEDLFTNAPIPSKSYEQLSFTNNEIVLIIGNEAHGLSTEAKKLAFSRYGQLVYIPLAHGVESLNSVVAAGIMMFEIRKQIGKILKLKQNTRKSAKQIKR